MLERFFLRTLKNAIKSLVLYVLYLAEGLPKVIQCGQKIAQMLGCIRHMDDGTSFNRLQRLSSDRLRKAEHVGEDGRVTGEIAAVDFEDDTLRFQHDVPVLEPELFGSTIVLHLVNKMK